jgi:hypothetical protein
MNLDTIQSLKAHFPPESHKERELPGGKRWTYIPWQQVRERLDQACPDWTCEYSDPIRLPDGETVIRCKLTIEDCTREGMGVSPPIALNDSGRRKGIGSPVEVAVADAFKNAAEQFGVGAYLDDQKELIRYLKSQTKPALDVDACIRYAESKGLTFERAEEIILECDRDRETIFAMIKKESSK